LWAQRRVADRTLRQERVKLGNLTLLPRNDSLQVVVGRVPSHAKEAEGWVDWVAQTEQGKAHFKGGLVMRNHSTDKVDLSVAYELIGHPSMHAPVDVLYTLTRHAGEVSAAHGRKRRSIDTRSDAAHGVQFSLSQSRCGPLHERGEDYM